MLCSVNTKKISQTLVQSRASFEHSVELVPVSTNESINSSTWQINPAPLVCRGFFQLWLYFTLVLCHLTNSYLNKPKTTCSWNPFFSAQGISCVSANYSSSQSLSEMGHVALCMSLHCCISYDPCIFKDKSGLEAFCTVYHSECGRHSLRNLF